MITAHTRLALFSLLTITTTLTQACRNDLDEGHDFIEPEDLRDNLELMGVYDCTERSDTGYTGGDDFSIRVVTVDGRPIEVATANAYIAMQTAARNAGVSLRIVSGFRTMDQQEYLYGCYTNCNCNSCNLAARPGYSNHQSGSALDLNTSESGVLTWLNNNGSRFGFRRTVPSENWHWEWRGSAADYSGPCGGGAVADDCDELPAEGGVIDEDSSCTSLGGPVDYLRSVEGQGHDGDLVWTGTTDHNNAVNYAVWNLKPTAPGDYDVEVFVQGGLATSAQARYAITHGGQTHNVTIDQRGGNRWVNLGTFFFSSSAGQKVRVNDNTGEAGGKKLVIDALRLTPASSVDTPNDCPYVEVNTAGDRLNVRPNPSTAQAAVGSLADGETVSSYGAVAGQSIAGNTQWRRVVKGSLSGYVSASFVTCRTAP
jgi:hypothetical protein